MKLEQTDLVARVGEMVRAAGIDNFRVERDILTMCGIDYRVEFCGCSDPDCNGLRLRRVRRPAARRLGSGALQ